MYLYSFISLPAKTGHKRGSCLQCIKSKSARGCPNGGFPICVWTVFTDGMNSLGPFLTRRAWFPRLLHTLGPDGQLWPDCHRGLRS